MEGNAICKNCKHFIRYYAITGVRLREIGCGHCGQKRSKAVWSDTKKACEKFDLRDELAWSEEKLERVLGFAKDTCAYELYDNHARIFIERKARQIVLFGCQIREYCGDGG